MKCKSCGGPLVMRETFSYPIDENGVFNTSDSAPVTLGISCLSCEARHTYEEIHVSGDRVTVALEVNSDPEPVATVTMTFAANTPKAIAADKLVGLLIVDEDRQEVGRFLALADIHTSDWRERMKKLEALIPKGQSRASFAEEEPSG